MTARLGRFQTIVTIVTARPMAACYQRDARNDSPFFAWVSLPEQREVHAAILAMLDEMGMLGEIVVLAVLEDEDAAGL